jgi:hypothetical protein
MKRIFVVTKEETDYTCPSQDILGIFSKIEPAKKFMDSFSHCSTQTIRIEEYIINPFMYDLNQGYKCYFLRMKKSGEVLEIELTDGPPATCLCIDPWFRKFAFDGNGNLLCHTYAKDENRAIKICNKERFKLIAQGSWPQDLRTI